MTIKAPLSKPQDHVKLGSLTEVMVCNSHLQLADLCNAHSALYLNLTKILSPKPNP